MGRLAGYRYRDVVAWLGCFGFSYGRPARGSHEVWSNDLTRRSTIIPRHPGDITQGTLRPILRQAGIAPEDFLA